MATPTLPDPAGRDAMSRRVAALEAALAARQKTVDVLIAQVRDRQRSQETAYSTLEQNVVLQQVVARKTRELGEQNLRLEQAHEALSLAQADLLEAQKLESIGRLAAGVAHEINTPVQFVNDSIFFIREGMEDLLALVDALGRLKDEAGGIPALAGAVAQADEAVEQADLDYLREHLPKAIERCQDGLNRVGTIVCSMREFAHHDQDEMSAVDLNRAIASTLVIARNEYKYVADMETLYGELPRVWCNAGEINQVVLNLVVNAAHAVGDRMKLSGARGRITIRTRQVGPRAEIEIEDTGGGIPEEISRRIFDPFFTTKEVGRGTGQGLAIARKVITLRHRGSLTFDSRPGEGTTFRILLPIEAPRDGVSPGTEP